MVDRDVSEHVSRYEAHCGRLRYLQVALGLRQMHSALGKTTLIRNYTVEHRNGARPDLLPGPLSMLNKIMLGEKAREPQIPPARPRASPGG